MFSWQILISYEDASLFTRESYTRGYQMLGHYIRSQTGMHKHVANLSSMTIANAPHERIIWVL